jgi:nucleoside-diphosphate-sugar epimerase
MSNEKKIFIAGATGVIGIRLCKMLINDNWTVYGTTRSENKTKLLKDIGVIPIVVDVYNAKKLENVIIESKPSIVVHQLTDLPTGLDPDKMEEALVSNAKLRIEGTRNLVNSAIKANVSKMIAQSIGFVYEPNILPHTEESPLLNFEDPIYGETSRAVASLEDQITNAQFVGIVLRNGLLYGNGTGFDSPVEFVPSVHVDAAANAAFLAINRKTTSIYNVADNDNRLSSEKIKSELGWSPDYRMI